MLQSAGGKEGRRGEREKRAQERGERKGKGGLPSQRRTAFISSVLMAFPFLEEESTDLSYVNLQTPSGISCSELTLWRWAAAAGRRNEGRAADSAVMALASQQPLMRNNELLNSDLLIKPQREQWRKLALQRQTERGACCAFINSPSTLFGILSEADILTKKQQRLVLFSKLKKKKNAFCSLP